MQVSVVEQLLVDVGAERSVCDAVSLAGHGPRLQVLLIGLICGPGHVELEGERERMGRGKEVREVRKGGGNEVNVRVHDITRTLARFESMVPKYPCSIWKRVETASAIIP